MCFIGGQFADTTSTNINR